MCISASTYHTLHGTSVTRARPKSLPPATKLPALETIFAPQSTILPPAQRTLCQVLVNRSWLAWLDGAGRIDAVERDTIIPHRECTRVVSLLQLGACAWVTQAPDASIAHGRQRSALETIALQRAGGLYLSALRDADAICAAHGEVPDPLGDRVANAGEHTRKHTGSARHRPALMRSASIRHAF